MNVGTPTPQTTKYLEDYALALGKLLSNLGALEFAIRMRLHKDDDKDSAQAMPRRWATDVPEGNLVPLNWITSWHQLGKLIDEYNRREQQLGSKDLLDTGIVDIRHAIAHGRVIGLSTEEPLRLLRFSKPVDGASTVALERRYTVTIEWMGEQVRMVRAAILTVHARIAIIDAKG
jgi:hypothetical protein